MFSHMLVIGAKGNPNMRLFDLFRIKSSTRSREVVMDFIRSFSSRISDIEALLNPVIATIVVSTS